MRCTVGIAFESDRGDGDDGRRGERSDGRSGERSVRRAAGVTTTMTSHATQRWVLVITVLAFGLMIFSVIPWSSIFGAATGPADDLVARRPLGDSVADRNDRATPLVSLD